ncbi:hypothetical protein GDO78_014695 [Eleutherodactylus coqui]|uniref:Uncharacterized protein n=1 Tax=Eleutherodactylus coqui TaxID=57060 RepID=A0A8J6EE89_ELECQ|nr:hypothetical protein GDO78_014695 [Eleutherodactylus coqui]
MGVPVYRRPGETVLIHGHPMSRCPIHCTGCEGKEVKYRLSNSDYGRKPSIKEPFKNIQYASRVRKEVAKLLVLWMAQSLTSQPITHQIDMS